MLADTTHQPATWRASLRLRLLLLGFLSVLPAFGLLSWSAYEDRRERLREAEQQAERVADRIAAEYGQLVDFTHATLERLTELPDVRQRRDPAACNRHLADVRKLNPAYGLIGVVDLSGRTVCAAEPAGLGVYLGDRDYIRQAFATGQFVASGFLVGRTTGMNIMVLAEPVLDDYGRVAAVAFLSLDLDWIGRQMQQMAVPPGSNVALVDGTGTVMALYPPDPAAVGRKIPELGTFLAQSPGGRVRGVRQVNPDGVSRVYVSTTLPRAPASSAFVRAGIPTAAIIDQANRALQRNLLALAGVAVLAFAAAWWMAGLLVVAPTRRLIAAAEALGRGDMAARSQLKHGADELGQLALHFDAMAANLQRVTRALRTLSAGNRCLLRAFDERALLEEMCRIAVQEGGYRLAWVGYAGGEAAGSIALAAINSADDGLRRQVEALASTMGDDPATLAVRLGTTQVLPGLAPQPTATGATPPLRLAVCALPLRIGSETIGALTLYADDAESFDAAEHELLEEMAADLAFGIATLRERAQRAALAQELAYLSTHDRLTGLPGHTLLADRLQQALSQARRHRRRAAVACLDIDNFRHVNSSLGTALGDAVLQQLARRLRGLLPDDDTVARLGSGEFVLLLTDREGVADTTDTLLQVLAAIREPMQVEGREIAVTASIGCSFYPDDGDDPELLQQRAKIAMHNAKEIGRDMLKFFAAGFDAAATERIELETDLRWAVPRGELLLHYQPQL